MIDLISIPTKEDKTAPPTAPLKWAELETLLNVVLLANQLGPNANNIGIAAREVLYNINQALYPDGPPTFPTTKENVNG